MGNAGRPYEWKPYALPLSPEAFCLALRRGQGRTMLHATRHGCLEHVDRLVEHCLFNRACDVYFEKDRAGWILDVADRGGVGDAVAGQCLGRALDAPSEDRPVFDLYHRCRVMYHLACKGYGEARQRIYQLFAMASERERSGDPVGGFEIIAIDGADGLIHVVERIGAWLGEDPQLKLEDYDKYLLGSFDEDHGEGAAATLLESLSSANPHIARYLSHCAAPSGVDDDANAFPPRNRHVTVDEIIEWVEGAGDEIDPCRRFNVGMGSWGRRADLPELAVVAARLREATTPVKLYLYLSVFRWRRLPGSCDVLFAAADHAEPVIRHAAYDALVHVVDPQTREFALARLQLEPMANGILHLLSAHYQPGDAAAVADALHVPDDEQDLHSLVLGLVHLVGDHPLPETHDLTLFAYEHSPCAYCRSNALRRMQKVGFVPDAVAEEALVDGDPQVRDALAGADDMDDEG